MSDTGSWRTAADVHRSARPKTVRVRAAIASAVVVGVSLAVAGVLIVSTLHGRLVGAQKDAAALRARDIAALASSGHLPVELSIPGEDRALIQIVDMQGHIVQQGANTQGEPAIVTLSQLRASHHVATKRGLPIGDGERFAVVSLRVSTPAGDRSIITAESLEGADDVTTEVIRLLLGGFTLVVGIVTLLVLGTTRAAFVPVGTMTAEVGEISANDLHRRVSSPTADGEIGELANAMNLLLDRLETASERERRFVADASHELRSPLASVRAALEIADTHPDKIDARTAIQDALADHVRLDRLVDDLLALARLDGTHDSGVDAVDLALLVSADLATRHNPKIEITTDLQSTIVTGIETQLTRVVRNVVDNACRHARSQVKITATPSGETVVVRVEDDGPGIRDRDRLLVFERFHRLDESRSADDGGSGLGLAIVRATLHAHDGTVGVDDSPLGGARFTITLPRTPTNEPGPGDSRWAVPRRSRHRTPRDATRSGVNS
jgi:signal transduction histidine kinase